MRRRQVIVLAGLFGLAAAALLLLSRRPHLGQQVLPDGTKLTLVALTTGTRHDNPMASLKQKLAAHLPTSWRAKLKVNPPETTSSERTTNYLTLWLTCEGKTGSKPPTLRFFISDDHGNLCINDGNSYSRDVSVQVRSNVWLQGLPVLAWPRRAEKLHIQVYPRDDGKLLAEFQVKNPGRDLSTPRSTAPPWPITLRDGDLDFTLTSLWLGVGSTYPDWKLRQEKNPIYRGTRATFQVTKNGELQTNWYAYHVREIRDALDNHSHGNSFEYTNREGIIMNQFGRPPLPVDDPWRMTVEFSRLSGFAPEELHTLIRVPVPQPGQSWKSATNYIGQNPLEIQWDLRPEDHSKDFGFWATVMPQKSDYKLTLLRATDDRGRTVATKNSGGGQSVTYDLLKLEPDASSVDLVFAYHRSRLITFVVKPEFFVLQPP